MAIGNIALTFRDLRKRQAPDGTIDHIIEVLEQANPIMDDIPWKQGNLPTGNLTTIRTSLPSPTLRAINRGVDPTKSSTKQITDTCCILQDRSQVDVELLALEPDPKAFRQSEDDAHVEGFSQKVASMIFYGDSDANLDEFNGLAKRYASVGGEKGTTGYQVVSAGGSTASQETSAWLIGWGERSVTGIYPKFGYAGLKQEDLGETDALDANNKPFRAVTTLFTWKPGLAVEDLREVAAVRNIDLSALSKSTVTAAEKRKVIESMITAKNRMRKLDGVTPIWYVSQGLYTFLETYLVDKNNVFVTRETLETGGPLLRLSGIPVKKVDCLSETEAVIS